MKFRPLSSIGSDKIYDEFEPLLEKSSGVAGDIYEEKIVVRDKREEREKARVKRLGITTNRPKIRFDTLESIHQERQLKKRLKAEKEQKEKLARETRKAEQERARKIEALKNSLDEMIQTNQVFELVKFLPHADQTLLKQCIAPAIELAIKQGHTYVISTLLNFYQPVPTANDYDHWLAVAVEAENIDAIGLLVHCGANIKNTLETFDLDAKQADNVEAKMHQSYILACLYERGYGVKKDVQEAEKYLLDAKAINHHQAILELGRLHRKAGKYDEAKDCFETVIDDLTLKGAPDFELGHMVQRGEACKVEFKATAEDYYKSAIRAGHQKAKTELGRISFQNHDEAQKKEAIKLWHDAAHHRDVDACFELLQHHQVGEKDEYIAFARDCSLLLEIDERLGIASSVGLLGQMYEQGHYIDAQGRRYNDIKKAYDCYKKAVELGDVGYRQHLAEAAYQLGSKKALKNDGAYNQENVDYILEAADFGSHRAYFLLGTMYHKGKGVHQSDDKAEYYYKKALDSDDQNATYACINLFNLYAELAEKNLEIDAHKVCDYNEKALALDYSKARLKSGELYLKLAHITLKADEQKACEYAERAHRLGCIGIDTFYYELAMSRLNEDEQAACDYASRAGELRHPHIQHFDYCLANKKLDTNPKEGCMRIKNLALQEYPPAQNQLAELYYQGNYRNQADEKVQKTGIALKWWRKAASHGHPGAKKHLEAWYLIDYLSYYFRDNPDSTMVAYHLAMAQDKTQFSNLFFEPDSRLSKVNNLKKNRLLLTCLLDDDLLDTDDKQSLVAQLVEQKIKTPAHFIACLPSEKRYHEKVAGLLISLAKKHNLFLISGIPDDLAQYAQNKGVLIVKDNQVYKIYCMLQETETFDLENPIVIENKDDNTKEEAELKNILGRKNLSGQFTDDPLPCQEQRLIELVYQIAISKGDYILQSPSTTATIQNAFTTFIGIQPALNRAKKQLHDMIDTQPKEVQERVLQNTHDVESKDEMLVFTAVQLQNLIEAFENKAFDKGHPQSRQNVEKLRALNKSFDLFIHHDRVIRQVPKEAQEQFSSIYNDLCECERQLQRSEGQSSYSMSFELTLGLRLLSLYTAACSLYSGKVQRTPTRGEILKQEGFHIAAAFCHIIPGLHAIPEFLEASVKILESLEVEISHITLGVVSAAHVLFVGFEMLAHSTPTPDQKLSTLYHNLGLQGRETIEIFVDAMNQRYQPVLEELVPEDRTKLADAIAEHIANFLMYNPLEKTEGKNLVRYMILWCSTHKMETKETVKWHGIDIPIAELLCGLSLRCEYMANGVKQEHDLIVVARKNGEGNEVSLSDNPILEGHILASDWEVSNFVNQLQVDQNMNQQCNDDKKHDGPEPLPEPDIVWEQLSRAQQEEYRRLESEFFKAREENEDEKTTENQEKYDQADKNLKAYKQVLKAAKRQKQSQPIITKTALSELLQTNGGSDLLKFDNDCIVQHANKDPRSFKAPLTIKPSNDESIKILFRAFEELKQENQNLRTRIARLENKDQSSTDVNRQANVQQPETLHQEPAHANQLDRLPQSEADAQNAPIIQPNVAPLPPQAADWLLAHGFMRAASSNRPRALSSPNITLDVQQNTDHRGINPA